MVTWFMVTPLINLKRVGKIGSTQTSTIHTSHFSTNSRKNIAKIRTQRTSAMQISHANGIFFEGLVFEILLDLCFVRQQQQSPETLFQGRRFL